MPTRAIVDQGRNEVASAVEERDVVRMARNARLVESNKHVDCSGRLLIALRFHRVRKVRRKSRGE